TAVGWAEPPGTAPRESVPGGSAHPTAVLSANALEGPPEALCGRPHFPQNGTQFATFSLPIVTGTSERRPDRERDARVPGPSPTALSRRRASGCASLQRTRRARFPTAVLGRLRRAGERPRTSHGGWERSLRGKASLRWGGAPRTGRRHEEACREAQR